jgi:hypothetical protein
MIGKLIKLLFCGALIVTISSCDRDSCRHVTCPTNLECASGSCVCLDGYEGTDCSTLSSTKYTSHSWLVNNNCNDPNSSGQYYTQIYTCNNAIGVNCITFNGLVDGQSVSALIENTSAGNLGNTLVINSQSSGAITIQQGSSGTYFASSATSATPYILINLNYVNGNNAFSCQFTLYQQ